MLCYFVISQRGHSLTQTQQFANCHRNVWVVNFDHRAGHLNNYWNLNTTNISLQISNILVPMSMTTFQRNSTCIKQNVTLYDLLITVVLASVLMITSKTCVVYQRSNSAMVSLTMLTLSRLSFTENTGL
jgi:hypothetical protein